MSLQTRNVTHTPSFAANCCFYFVVLHCCLRPLQPSAPVLTTIPISMNGVVWDLQVVAGQTPLAMARVSFGEIFKWSPLVDLK